MARLCECGCGEPLAGRRPEARYATDQCRARDWKAKRGYGPQRRPGSRTNASGLQVSFRKAVDVLADEFDGYLLPWEIESALKLALPDRQRQRLEARR